MFLNLICKFNSIYALFIRWSTRGKEKTRDRTQKKSWGSEFPKKAVCPSRSSIKTNFLLPLRANTRGHALVKLVYILSLDFLVSFPPCYWSNGSTNSNNKSTMAAATATTTTAAAAAAAQQQHPAKSKRKKEKPIMFREFPKNGRELYLISSSHKTKPCIDTNWFLLCRFNSNWK